MKEGYYQKKIAEFSEKLQDFMHRLNMAETEFDRYQEELGQFKDLLKKLKNIEDFQQNSIDAITRKGKLLIEKNIVMLNKNAEKNIEKTITQKTSLINKILLQINQDEELFKKSIVEIQQFRQELQYYKEFQTLFILKLINKGILNHQELSELELRSKKRVRDSK